MPGQPPPAISADASPAFSAVAPRAGWDDLQGERFAIRMFEATATAVVGSVRRDGELQVSVVGTKGQAYKNVLLYDTFVVQALMFVTGALFSVFNSVFFFGLIGFGLIGLGVMALLGYLLLFFAMKAALLAAPFAVVSFVVDRLERRVHARQSQRILDQVATALSPYRCPTLLAA